MAIAEFKRKKFLINKSLQFKLIGTFASIGLIAAFVQVVLVNSSLLAIARETEASNEAILKHWHPMMTRNVLWALVAIVPLMTCVGILVTHRIAGPAHSLTQYCKQIAEGGPITKCVIRKGDELQDLCNSMNAAFERVASSEDPSEEHTEEWQLEATPSLVQTTSTAPSEKEAPKESEPASFFSEDDTAA